jgi:16S rRNA processing protein RimM
VIDFFLIAEVKVVVDTSGYVSVLPFSDFPEQFGRLKKVYIDVFGAKRIFFVEDVFLNGKHVSMKFKNIDSEKDAKYLVGAQIYIDKASAAKLDENTFYIHDLINCKVVFHNEFFGTLVDVMRLPANDVYVIQHKDGKEILIPAVSEFIDSFNDELKELKLKNACEIFLNDED